MSPPGTAKEGEKHRKKSQVVLYLVYIGLLTTLGGDNMKKSLSVISISLSRRGLTTASAHCTMDALETPPFPYTLQPSPELVNTTEAWAKGWFI